MVGRWLLAALTLAASVTGAGAAADSRQAHGVAFPERVALADRDLPLRGVGTLRYGFFFKAYVAALYADGVPPQALLYPVTPRRLEIVYFVDIPSERIAEFAEQRLQEQLGADRWRRLAPRVRDWHGRFRDVASGDRYVMEYHAGTLSLALNGQTLARVEDPQLAAAYFGLWLGTRPIDDGLRAALLGEGADS
jgi:hypothetical protein